MDPRYIFPTDQLHPISTAADLHVHSVSYYKDPIFGKTTHKVGRVEGKLGSDGRHVVIGHNGAMYSLPVLDKITAIIAPGSKIWCIIVGGPAKQQPAPGFGSNAEFAPVGVIEVHTELGFHNVADLQSGHAQLRL